MTVTKNILISHVCSTYESESEEFPVDGNLFPVCSTDKDKSKRMIVDESSAEEKTVETPSVETH